MLYTAGSESDSDEDERQDSRAAVSGEDSDSDEGPQEMSEALRKRLSQVRAQLISWICLLR